MHPSSCHLLMWPSCHNSPSQIQRPPLLPDPVPGHCDCRAPCPHVSRSCLAYTAQRTDLIRVRGERNLKAGGSVAPDGMRCPVELQR
eukprot:6870525-Pyramimonas_sp.AAC.1